METPVSDEKLRLVEECPTCGRDFERPPQKRARFWASLFAVAAALLIAFSAVINLRASRQVSPRHRVQPPIASHDGHLVGSPSSPLNGHEQWRLESWPHEYWHNKLFFGDPSYESDWAWINLTRARAFRLHPSEAVRLNITDSVRVKPGEDYGTILGVIHNLHCLRRIRQMLYPDYYYPNAPEDLMRHNMAHAIHCLESLRTSVICYPDLNPHPYYWSGIKYHDIGVSAKVTRKCVDWEAMLDLLELREIDPEDFMRDTGPQY